MNQLVEQQQNAIQNELEKNAEKKEKEDELTEKINHFNITENDQSKQLD